MPPQPHQTHPAPALPDTPPAPAPPSPPPTASGVAAAFLLTHHGRTRQSYTEDLRHFAQFCARHHLDPLTATPTHLAGYLEQMRHQNAAPATIARRLSCLTGFYDHAIGEDLIARNPASRLRRPRVGDNTVSTGLSATEANRLLAAAHHDNPRSDAIVHLLLLCGLRVTELVTARVEDLRTERGHRTITVTRKGGRRQRLVLPPPAAHALDTYLAGRTHGPLVATATGKPLDRHAIWRLLRRLARTALPHLADTLHPHDLRHACATLALDAGAQLRDVQDLLGHADPRTTRRYDRARHNLDRSPSYALAGLLAAEPTPPTGLR